MTAILNLVWDVDTATLGALVAAGYDAWKVERDVGAGFIEFSYTTTRPPLAANVLKYVYMDAAGPVDGSGDPDADYQATPYRTSDGAVGAAVVATATRRGYIVPQDIWDEGYANPPWTPTKLWKAIDRATATIDSICRQWFDARYAQFTFDGSDHDKLWLDIPICALHLITQDSTVVDLSDIEVYNRHLTRGQLNPDDRANPQITYALDFLPGYRGRRRRIYADSALFGAGRKNVILKGVFGYTELAGGDFAAETTESSQVPVSYGSTPAEIRRAALLLALNYMLPADEQQEASLEGRVTQVRTRDQYVSFADPSKMDAGYGLTGSVEIDNILMRFTGPLRMGAVGR